MKKAFVFLSAAAGIVGGLSAASWSAKSPDGLNEIRLDTDPALRVTVLRRGQPRAEMRDISLDVAGRGVLGGAGCSAAGAESLKRDAVIETPIYKRARVKDDGVGTRVSFGDWSVELHARNDGVAYRFATALGGEITVKGETARLAFPSADQKVWAAANRRAPENDPLQDSWEGVYGLVAVNDAPAPGTDKIWYMPITASYPDGVAMTVTESDILDYPGCNFARGGAPASLDAVFARYPAKTRYWTWGDTGYTEEPTRYQRVIERTDFLARTSGTRTFPWRVFVLADGYAQLPAADIVYALASPSKIGDASWVKPGKVAWDWWNCWNVSGEHGGMRPVDFKAGCNTKTYEYYIDFAAKYGVEYVIFDEGWSQKLKIMEVNPEVDVPHLIKYGKERGVGIILWAAWAQFLGREEQVVSHYAKMGAAGFKIDFMDRDDQVLVNFLARMAALCAKYRLVVDYHGMYKPAGFQRTYPNTLNFEGVHGLECCKGGKACTYFPDKDCTIVYTRMVAGPMDYTPGAMVNVPRNRWKPTPWQPSTPGTRAHQMALMALYEAPLQMLCDSPTQYLKNKECFTFMAQTPVTWDDTVGIAGAPDKFAAIARRKGDAWYLAAIAGADGYDAAFDTSFLGAGRWDAEIFADGLNSDRDATDYVHQRRTVAAGEKLCVKIPSDGGYVVRFTPAK
ncbi:MAG: glycoside hydrolase family 97 catalytic domain-containing protein [Kiritimatiellae bacterium]|nr:glycoside hydrolase family 97 catalytic domain-containing protein [Kiritimatiellia bacterium]